jgi:hypothetical protein
MYEIIGHHEGISKTIKMTAVYLCLIISPNRNLKIRILGWAVHLRSRLWPTNWPMNLHKSDKHYIKNSTNKQCEMQGS